MRKICALCQEQAVACVYPQDGKCYLHHGEEEGWYSCPREWKDRISLCQGCFDKSFPPGSHIYGGTSISDCPECHRIHHTATTVHRGGERVFLSSEYGSKYDTCLFKFCRKEHQERYMKRWLKFSHDQKQLDHTLCLCDPCVTTLLRKGIIVWK